jgi:hypothetical protein
MAESVQYETRRDYPAGQRRSDLQPGQDILDYLKAYAREKPDVAALWCLGVGFVLGWKLKPW